MFSSRGADIRGGEGYRQPEGKDGEIEKRTSPVVNDNLGLSLLQKVQTPQIETNHERNNFSQIEKSLYGKVLFDWSKVFHGVGFDLMRAKSILKHGILSKSAAGDILKDNNFSINGEGYNLDDSISVALSPSINSTFESGAFACYISSGISFIISNVPVYRGFGQRERDSILVDEAFVKDSINRRKIVGIMVPEDKLLTPLSKLPMNLTDMMWNCVDTRCEAVVKQVQQECGFKYNRSKLKCLIDEKNEIEASDLNFKEKRKQRDKAVDNIELFIQNYIEQAFGFKMKVESPTLKDVLTEYIPKGIKTYNSKGFEIEV